MKEALKRAKWRQRLVMLGLAILAAVVVVGIVLGSTNFLAGRQSTKLRHVLENHQAVAAPNVDVDAQYLSGNNAFGGQMVTVESKNIDGYTIPWRTLTSSYDVTGYATDELTTTYPITGNALQPYAISNTQKLAAFVRPGVANPPQEAAQLKDMPGYVAEVAITFDHPYTYAQLQQFLPANVNLRWGYVLESGTRTKHEKNDPPLTAPHAAIIDPLGRDLSRGDGDLKAWQTALNTYWEDYEEDLKGTAREKVYKEATKATAKTLQYRGVIVTGTTENLAALTNPHFFATSVGATVQRVPYIKPTK